MAKHSAVAAILAFGVCAWAGTAVASPFDLYGATPEGMAMGAGMSAWADDGSASFFNPAGLGIGGRDGKASVQLGYMYYGALLHIDRPSTDPAAIAIPTHEPTHDGVIFGSLLVPLGGVIHNKASLGVAFALPQSGFLNVEAREPRDPQWLRYGTDADRITAVASLGIHPWKQLSFGVGVQALASFAGHDNFTVDLATKTLGNREVTFRLSSTTAPIAGVTWLPNDAWRIALAYRGAIGLDITQPVSATITGDPPLGTLNITAGGTVLYTPHTVSLAATWTPTDALSVGLDLRYELWSLAPSPAFAVTLASPKDGSLLGGFITDPNSTRQPNLAFSDTLTATLGAQYRVPETGLTLRASYGFRPHYGPPPTADAHYLDSNTHLLGAGLSWHFADPLQVFPQGLRLEAGVHAQIQPDQASSVAGDPVGQLTYGGAVLAASLALKFQY